MKTFLLIMLIILVGCTQQKETQNEVKQESIASSKDTIITAKGNFEIPGQGFIDGRDTNAQPPLTLMNVNVWSSTGKNRISCKLRHGTAVEIIDHKSLSGEIFFEIMKGNCKGWITSNFLSDKYYEPIGDQF